MYYEVDTGVTGGLMKTNTSRIFKIMYGISSYTSGLLLGSIGSYLMFYYTDIALIPFTLVGSLFFFGKILNAFFAFLTGIMIDKTESRFGKIKPYLFVSSISLTIFTIMIFLTPYVDDGIKLIYVSLVYILWGLSSVVYNTAYASVFPTLTRDSEERNKLSIIPMIGNVLGDLIASNIIPVIRLKEIHRQAKDSYIIKFASLVNEQKLTKEDLVSHEDVIFYNGNTNDIKRVILNQIKGALNKGYSLLEDIQVLIPFYKGDLGIDVMNKEIQKMFNPSYLKSKSMSYGDKTYYENDKVIQLVNNSENGIMNGDIGVIKSIFLDNNEKLTMQIEFDDSIVLYNQSDLDNINLAYVISIHKSQGSEYKIVFMPIIRSYLHMLKKELIYTAITRSKEYLLILGDMSLLTFASNQLEDKRKTYLIKHLTNNYEELNLFQEEDPFEDLSPYDLMDN